MKTAATLFLVISSTLLWGCVTTSTRLDPTYRWQRAERGLQSALQAAQEIWLLRNEYEAVVFLDREGKLRGRAFLRLAELDLAQHNYLSARANFEQALRAGINSSEQTRALLSLGDVLERKLKRPADAKAVYEQLVHEHPGTVDAELATLRIEVLGP